MSFDLTSDDTTRASAADRAMPGGRSLWSMAGPWIGFAGLFLVYMAVPLGSAARVAVGHAALTTAPLAAALACAAAARRLSGKARLPWLFFTAGALAAGVGHGYLAVAPLGPAAVPPSATAPYLVLLALHLPFATGALLALRPIPARGVALAIGLDGALILTGAAIVVQRFVLEPLSAAAAVDPLLLVTVLAAQLAAVGSVFVMGHHVLRDSQNLLGGAVPALAGTAALFLLGSVLAAMGAGSAPLAPNGALDLVWLAGWALLATAGRLGGRLVRRGEAMPSPLQRRLRQAVVPGAALFLGAVAMDGALRPVANPEIAAASALLGMVLALRIAHALRTAEHRKEERRQLAQTRALIEVSQALAAATDLNRTLETVVLWTCRLLGARTAGIELLDDEGATLELRTAHGLPARAIGGRFPVASSFTGRVVRERRPQATLDPAGPPFRRPDDLDFLGSSPTAAAPLRFGDRVLGTIFVTDREQPFDAADLELLGALADQAALAIENAQLFEQVRRLSLTDPLTGLANRRQLERDLLREFAAARRGRPLVAALFDLDDFKDYNDRHGHLAGDEVLRILGRVLEAETRAMNLAARYGGDEFLVLLADCDRAGAAVFVERVRRHFDQEMARQRRPALSMSAGLAEYRPGMETVEDLVAASDRALYTSKGERPGRSRT